MTKFPTLTRFTIITKPPFLLPEYHFIRFFTLMDFVVNLLFSEEQKLFLIDSRYVDTLKGGDFIKKGVLVTIVNSSVSCPLTYINDFNTLM